MTAGIRQMRAIGSSSKLMNDSISILEGQDGLELANIFDSCLLSGVVVVDGRKKIRTVSPRAEKMVRLKASRLVNRSVDLLPAGLVTVIQKTLSSRKPILGRKIILPAERGNHSTLLVNTTLTGGRAVKKPGVIAVLNDISAAATWESNMRRVDRLHSVGTLAASMAHEVKNAFVAVKTFVDLLVEKNQQAELAEVVRAEMRKIDSIISQMLKLSAPAKPEFSAIHLNFVLNKSLLLIQHLMEEKRIRLTRAFAAGPDHIEGDANQLEQVFINLLFNAIDAMGHDGHLTVITSFIPGGAKVDAKAGKSLPMLRVVVQDSGSGVAPENLPRLFEPFFTTKADGTGLGLAIVRRVVQEHGGTVNVESELNKGTTFTVLLPAVANGS